jgi:hypothetical protein
MMKQMSDEPSRRPAPETALQMTERHVLEGATRIANQKMLIIALEKLTFCTLLPAARHFLEDIETFQAQAVEHMEIERLKALGRPEPTAHYPSWCRSRLNRNVEVLRSGRL